MSGKLRSQVQPAAAGRHFERGAGKRARRPGAAATAGQEQEHEYLTANERLAAGEGADTYFTL